MVYIFKEAERNTIIVNEINKWKQNKILPASYCDFLINLYDGPGGGQANLSNVNIKEIPSYCDYEDRNKGPSIKNKLTLNKLLLLILSVFLTSAFIALIVSFDNFDPSIQIIFLLAFVFVAYLFLFFYKLNGKNEVILLLAHNFTSILFVFIVLYISQILGMNKMNLSLLFFFLAVFFVWLLTGIWLKHLIVFTASLLGSTIVYYYYVFTVSVNASLLVNEFYWLPLLIILFWIAYSINQHNHLYKYSIVLLGMGLLYYIMPIIMLIINRGQDFSLVYLFVKLFIFVIATNILRKRFVFIKVKDMEL